MQDVFKVLAAWMSRNDAIESFIDAVRLQGLRIIVVTAVSHIKLREHQSMSNFLDLGSISELRHAPYTGSLKF
jgi:Tfp pilus assembly PilM family ATPase